MANDIEKITSDFSEEQTEKTYQKDGNCNRTPKSKDKKNVAKARITNALLIMPAVSVIAINVFLTADEFPDNSAWDKINSDENGIFFVKII